MSIVNRLGEKQTPSPRRQAVFHVKSSKIQARNRRWHHRKQTEGLSIRELARLVRKPVATVARGVLWAQREADQQEARRIENERPPVLDPSNGMDAHDVLYLLDQYPPESELGSDPAYRAYLAPLVERVQALYPTLGDLMGRLAPLLAADVEADVVRVAA